MCIYSMIADDFLKRRWPTIPISPVPDPTPSEFLPSLLPAITREEFDELKREVAELSKLLKAAKKYDEATGQTDCEDADKVRLLRELGRLLGVEIPEP